MRQHVLRGLLLTCALFTASVEAHSWDTRVMALLRDPEVDLLDAKLAIDAQLDGATDAADVRRQVDAWVDAARARTPAPASLRTRVEHLLSTLYVAGPWNGHRPVAYDLEDPFARQPRSRLLATYLDTRRGNCVTMPLLVAIVGQRLGLPLALARAPQHLFVTFRDDDSRWMHVEATSGGFKDTDGYIRDTGISQLAIARGVYLHPLTPRQAVATLAVDLVTDLSRRGNDTAALALAERLVDADPLNVFLMVRIGSLHARVAARRFHARWPDPADVPVALHAEYRALHAANAAWFAKAEALGWSPSAPGSDAAYLESIEAERRRRQSGAP